MSLPGRFLQIGPDRVFVHRSGRPGGTPLVLLHGFFASHWEWRHLVAELGEEHDVVAFDWPGYGESDRPSADRFRYDAPAFLDVLIGVLDSLEIPRAILVGHSMGGGLALYAAARRPDRVARLVAIDPLVYPFPIPVEGRVLLTPVVGPALFRGMLTRGLIRRFLRRELYRDPALVTEDHVDYLWERVNRPGGHEAVIATVRFLTEPGIIGRSVRAVRAPTLIVWGEDDRLFPASWGPRLVADLAGSRLELIPECGHSPPEERPRELLELVKPFLRDASERRALG